MGLEIRTDLVQRAALAVANGDDEVPAQEDGHLADLDQLVVVDVTRGLHDHEQGVAEGLELRRADGRGWRPRPRVGAARSARRPPRRPPVRGRVARSRRSRPGRRTPARERSRARFGHRDALPALVEAAVHHGGSDLLGAEVFRRLIRPRSDVAGATATRPPGGIPTRHRKPGEAIGGHGGKVIHGPTRAEGLASTEAVRSPRPRPWRPAPARSSRARTGRSRTRCRCAPRCSATATPPRRSRRRNWSALRRSWPSSQPRR